MGKRREAFIAREQRRTSSNVQLKTTIPIEAGSGTGRRSTARYVAAHGLLSLPVSALSRGLISRRQERMAMQYPMILG